jgi:hypothetical protein
VTNFTAHEALRSIVWRQVDLVVLHRFIESSLVWQAYIFPNIARAPGTVASLHAHERHPTIMQLIKAEKDRPGCESLNLTP